MSSTVASRQRAQMHVRLNALLRKANVADTDGEAMSLVSFLLKHISKKRDYEDILGDGDGAHAFAERHGLIPRHRFLLLEMQRVKDIFIPSPLYDFILTFMFLALVAFIVYAMLDKGTFLIFLCIVLGIDCVVHRVKDVSLQAGRALSAWLLRSGIVDEDPLAGPIQAKKWQEQSWQLFVHVGFTVIELLILTAPGVRWWQDTRQCWVPHPDEQHKEHTPLFAFFYMAQLGVWIYTCFIHRFVDERRKDYFVMYLHHIATIALVGVSWWYGYWRIGIIVVFIHDISDILVDTLKMVNYLKLEGASGYFASEIAYVMCVLSWLYFRLFEYPFRVLPGAYRDTWVMLGGYPKNMYVPRIFDLPLLSPPDAPWLVELVVLLFLLLALHIYWFHLFLMIGYRILTESVREASRQEYEGDSDDGGEVPAMDTVEEEVSSGSSSGKSGRARGGSLGGPSVSSGSEGGEVKAGTGVRRR